MLDLSSPAALLTAAILGLAGLLAGAVRFLFSGALIPRSVHEEALAVRDRQIEHLTAALTESQRQVTELLEVGRTVDQVLSSIEAVAREGR